MNKYTITTKIENFAPPETAEAWDASGFAVETSTNEVHKIMLCLTPTQDVVNQARNQNCDMIISHHPLFFVPLDWADIDIYSAHTNLDKAQGGTTDTIIQTLGLEKYSVDCAHEFLRMIDFGKQVQIEDFSSILAQISPNARIINNKGIKSVQRVAFCAGSGSEFINDAKKLGANVLVTGDLKFHTALEAEIVVYDIGHFEAEILILPVIKNLIGKGVEIVYAQEKSPFEQI